MSIWTDLDLFSSSSARDVQHQDHVLPSFCLNLHAACATFSAMGFPRVTLTTSSTVIFIGPLASELTSRPRLTRSLLTRFWFPSSGLGAFGSRFWSCLLLAASCCSRLYASFSFCRLCDRAWAVSIVVLCSSGVSLVRLLDATAKDVEPASLRPDRVLFRQRTKAKSSRSRSCRCSRRWSSCIVRFRVNSSPSSGTCAGRLFWVFLWILRCSHKIPFKNSSLAMISPYSW
mmetsp:Transcript_1708/g.7456  ORF Transcript_1708/g.7456 Transcript_1708/m.7456 type:complete len:230 (-) Transcript_1708:1409-2098(-)|eukprot:scaffold576_cov260-Pinguiococcus_pyrenoidosus.AAC.54